ncbi:MAG: hypothetical protein ABL888_05395 [Pirellulaceae bacterium]
MCSNLARSKSGLDHYRRQQTTDTGTLLAVLDFADPAFQVPVAGVVTAYPFTATVGSQLETRATTEPRIPAAS